MYQFPAQMYQFMSQMMGGFWGGNLWGGMWFVGLLALWALPWKGVALWKAARRGETWWFVALFLLNTLAILEILYIFIFSEKKKEITSVSKE